MEEAFQPVFELRSVIYIYASGSNNLIMSFIYFYCWDMVLAAGLCAYVELPAPTMLIVSLNHISCLFVFKVKFLYEHVVSSC